VQRLYSGAFAHAAVPERGECLIRCVGMTKSKERHVYEDSTDLNESAGGARSEPGGRAQRPSPA
jgi:hypothetical protein